MSKKEFKNISHYTKYSDESRGTNKKEWLLSPDKKLCLYKMTQIKNDNTSTNAHFSESIYNEIGNLVGIECANVELAVKENKKGIISYYFLNKDEELIDFNSLIQNIRIDYLPKSLKCKKTKEYYSVDLLLEAIKSVVYDRCEYRNIRKNLVELIITDALCDHYDRNSSNIALIRDYTKTYNKQFRLAPAYDNGTSLWASLPTEIAKKYLESENGLQEIDDRIISKIGIGNKRFCSYQELLNYIFSRYYEDATDIIKRLENLDDRLIFDIVFQDKYKDLDKWHKKLIILKLMFNKNKILNIYKQYSMSDNKTYKKSMT